MDMEAEIRRRVDPRRVCPAGLRYNLIGYFAQTFYRDLDPDQGVELDPGNLADLAIRAETGCITRAIEGLQRVLVIGVNAAWPALRMSNSVTEVVVVHPDSDQARLAKDIALDKWGCTNVRFVSGEPTELPLRDDSVDCVVSDCGLASWRDSTRISAELFRVLDGSGLLVAREANWEFELQGKALDEEWSFKRYGGDIYYGYTKRTLDPPREAEYICLLDQDNLWIQNLRSVPREALRRVSPEDGPGLPDLLVSAEYFEIRQMTPETLAELLLESGFVSVEIQGSEFEAAGDEHFARVRRNLEKQGFGELAKVVTRSWESLTAVGSPLLFATAVKPR